MKEIPLTKGYVAIVDDEDYEELSRRKWYCGSHGYAIRSSSSNAKRKTVLMHRELMGNPLGFEIDHIDHNILNNQKSNLRVCTHSDNKQNRPSPRHNTSGYKGVIFDKRSKKWYAKIGWLLSSKHLGTFATAEDAAHAYDKKAKELFGEFACLNFPIDGTP